MVVVTTSREVKLLIGSKISRCDSWRLHHRGIAADAEEFARNVPQYRIILIDGENLARLMIEHKVGVTVSRRLELVEIDENFFTEE